MALRGVSFHPAWHGSRLEESFAFVYAGKQSWDGGWTGCFPSFALGVLERLQHPVARFAALRSIPRLVASQRPDGLWHEPTGVRPVAPWYNDMLPGGCIPPLEPEQSTFLILRSLKLFGFLKPLLPK